IDDNTLNELGRWPFSRSRMGDAVTHLRADGAATVAWDVVFSEPDQNSELSKMRELKADLERLGLTGGEDRAALEKAKADLIETQGKLPANRRAELDAAIAAVEAKIDDIVKRQAGFYADVVESERKANNDLYFA